MNLTQKCCFLINSSFMGNGQYDLTDIFSLIQNILCLFRLRDRENGMNGRLDESRFNLRIHLTDCCCFPITS